jgi:amino acid transporter
MFSFIKKLLIGKALKTEELHGEKFNVIWGLPILASDAISSVAYAGEEMLWVLVPILGLGAYKNMFYASLAIVMLLFILVFSYRQTINSYPNGGGSYVVSKDNLGTIPSLVAASALTIDYMLTVAVSTSAGAAAVTSALPQLLPHKVVITLVFITILRGIKDSSKLFGIPTYLFIVTIIILIVTGVVKTVFLGQVPTNVMQIPAASGDITILLFLKAFASGCTALTGVEAVSDGIPNFQAPAQKNAKRVLALLSIIVLIIFGGLSYLATMYKAVPSHDVTVIAQIASQVFGGSSFMFMMVQFTTALILIMAANTAFADFPLLLSIIARDGYVPRQLSKRGTRLSFSNGIVLLCIAAGILVVIFDGSTHLLMPLYAIGVFVSFTLSQFGMFTRWRKLKSDGWVTKAIINGTGALITAGTVIIIGATKFRHGAWIVCILIPVIVFVMHRVKVHYNKVAQQLKKDDFMFPIKRKEIKNYVIIPVDTFNKAFIKSLNYAKAIGGEIEAYHVSIDDDATEKLKFKYEASNLKTPLVIEDSPYRTITTTLLRHIDKMEKKLGPDTIITVVIHQFVVKKWWLQLLHNQTAIFIKAVLLSKRNIALVTIPYIIEE